MDSEAAKSLLARTLLAGEPTVEAIRLRAAVTFGRRWRWIGSLAQRYFAAFASDARPRLRDVLVFLDHDHGFARAWLRHRDTIAVAQWIPEPQQMHPVPAAASWDIPSIETIGDLSAWLDISQVELDWFAGLANFTRHPDHPKLRHYYYRVNIKRTGDLRLIEAPKSRLKQLQRRILTGILDHIPAHPATHGFVKGRSILTFAAPHLARQAVLRMDLRDFFPSISGPRVQSFFRTAGYPETVADRLGGICTSATPRDIWKLLAPNAEPRRLAEARTLHARPHLPQGAAASPAIANSCAYRLDCRLAGFAQAAGAVYTRYADDLAFSGDEHFARRAERFATSVAVIAREEGFAVNHRKTRVQRPGTRQRLAGLIVNERLNVPREDYDRLKAILTNCARLGPSSQNRGLHPDFRAHLEGRVGFVETVHAARGARLREILHRIAWD